MLCAHPHSITTHLCRPCKKEECTRNKGGVKDVHTCTSEDFLCEDYRESNCYSEHPKGSSNRHNKRNEHTRYQVSFLDFFVLPLSNNEFDTKTHSVTHNNLWKHHCETVKKHCYTRSFHTSMRVVLITNVEHTHQKSRDKRNHNETHDTLRVNGVVNTHTALRSCVRNQRKRFHSIINTAKSLKFTSRFKVRTNGVEKLFNHRSSIIY